MIRKAAVAGHFYPGNREQLVSFLKEHLTYEGERLPAKAIVAPHAGYPYSGSVAAGVYSRVALPRRFIIMCPNHTGLGTQISIMESGEWEIPTGTFKIDEKISHRIAMNVPLVTKDAKAHMFEHSLEVQLPFIAQSAMT